MEKKCFKCSKTKCLSEFYKHKQMKDGHVNKCKACNKNDVSKNYRENIEHYKEYDRGRNVLPHRVKARADYAKTEVGRLARNKGNKAWATRNPIKRMASTIVGNAVRDGRIEKPKDCEDCGSEPNILHGHHDDYAFVLQVRWLCPGCHNRWHKKNGPGLNA